MITTKAYVKQYKHLHLLKKHAQVFSVGRKYPLQVSPRVKKKAPLIILVLCSNLKFKYTVGGDCFPVTGEASF